MVQRAAAAAETTPAATIAALERWGAIAAVGESDVAAHRRLHDWLRPEVEVARVSRADFDAGGRATFASLAAICDMTRTIEGKRFAVIDLRFRFEDTRERPLFVHLYNSLATAEVNYKNGPLHRNEEEQLPTTDNVWRYIECYYAGGGTRLVVDQRSGLSFVSGHYGTFYVLLNVGANAVSRSPRLEREARVLSEAYRTGNWDPFSAAYPHRLRLLASSSAPAAPARAAAAAAAPAAAAAAAPAATARPPAS